MEKKYRIFRFNDILGKRVYLSPSGIVFDPDQAGLYTEADTQRLGGMLEALGLEREEISAAERTRAPGAAELPGLGER